jgi:hypothetical protein
VTLEPASTTQCSGRRIWSPGSRQSASPDRGLGGGGEDWGDRQSVWDPGGVVYLYVSSKMSGLLAGESPVADALYHHQ